MILDLCSGRGGLSQAFEEKTTLDIDPQFSPDILGDVRLWQPTESYDVILASPPCTAFSVASIPWNWKGHLPDVHVSEGLSIVAAVFKLIAQIRPRYYLVENPRGMLRKLIGPPTETIFLCSYGTPYKKPTDLWHNLPVKLALPCAPHQSAPRGSRAGAMAATIRNPAQRAFMPLALSQKIREVVQA